MPSYKGFLSFFLLNYGKFIRNFSDCVAPLTYMGRENLQGNVVHTEAKNLNLKRLNLV